MRIVCPQCGYSRDIPADKVPSKSSIATCPKCQFRFRFRGHTPQSDMDGEEPVYPPRPSRPSPAGVAPGNASVSYEPRIQRIYAPESEPEHLAPVPPRPQARWLPDPEPDSAPLEPSPAYQAESRTAYFGRPGEIVAPWGGELPPSERPGRTGSFRKSELFSSDGRHGMDPGPPEEPSPTVRRAEPESAWLAESPPQRRPEAVPEEAPPAPWERFGAESWPEPDLQPTGETFREPVQAPGGQSGHGPDVEPAGESMGEEQAQSQPMETLAGGDSVRDIWSRLQAMGGEPRRQETREQADTSQAAALYPDSMAPWEQLEHYGVVPAFLGVVKNILVRPGDFFDQLPPVTGKVRPLIFAILLSVAAMIFVLIWHSFGMNLGGLTDLGKTEGFQGLGSGAIGDLALLGLAPILTAAFVFLDSAMVHLLLGLLRSATRSFDETFRTICYAGCPWILTVLPVPYSYLIPVILIWHMTLQAIGLKKLHQAGYPQVLASVLVKWSLYFMASFAILHVLMTRR